MFKIKTKTTVRDIKALDKSSDVTHRAKNAFIRTKEQAEQTQQHGHDNYVEYAEDKVNEGAETAARKTGQTVENQGKKAIRDIRERHRLGKEAERADNPGENAPGQASQSEKSAAPEAREAGRQQAYRRQPEQAARHKTTSASGQSDLGKRRFVQSRTKRTVRAGGKTVKETAKGTVKTANKSIKTAGHTAKTTIKTSQAAAKTTVKTAQAAAKTAQRAAQAARAAARLAVATAKAVVKAIIATVKATVAAVKGLISLIAAGGWVVVVVILVICLVGLILGSAFGIFYSGTDTGSSLTIPQVISEINAEFQSDINKKIADASNGYENVTVIYDGDNDGDSNFANNWTDVLGIYAVKTTMAQTNATEVVTVTGEKKVLLKSIFEDMNTISIRTEVKSEETTVTDEHGNETTETVEKTFIYVNISSEDFLEAASNYGFNEQQMAMLHELMSPENYPLFAQLTGIDYYGGLTSEDLRNIISNLPTGTKGAAIVEAALTRLGDPYSMAKRGSGNYVDCSYFAWWAYKQADVSIPSTSVMQAKYCYDNGYVVGQSELQPGDLIFWTKTSCHCGRWHEIHHVGIYIGDNKVIEASSSKGRVVIREIWGLNGGTWQVYMFGRPYD